MGLFQGQPQPQLQKEQLLQHLPWKVILCEVTVSILGFFPIDCAEEDSIPVLQTIEKLKRVETVLICAQNCNQDPDCEFYKWKVIWL